MSAQTRYYTTIRSYVRAQRRRPVEIGEALSSMVRWYERKAKLEGVDTSPDSAWRRDTADFMVREYAPFDRDFPQDQPGVLSWIADNIDPLEQAL